MAFSEADLDLLDEMVVSNTLESETADGKRVKFGNMNELKARIAYISRRLRGRRKTTAGFVSFADGDAE
jgi:hypothetical protein